MKQHQLRHHHVLRAACLLLLVSITGIAAFKLPYSHSNFIQNHMQGRKGRVFMTQASDDCDRRSLLSAGAVLSSFFALSLSSTPPARASVAFDPDRYGDKELKIATVNKLKQKLRNAIAGDLSLAVAFVRLAINDGIGYDAATNEGGPDGSIAFEMDRDQNAGLKPALETLLKVKREIQSTNEVTFGDVCAFAGAVAIESTGGPRIPVQLGRTDSGATNKNNVGASGYAWNSMSGDGLLQTFTKAGFGAREAVLLYGAMGAVYLATKDAGKTAGEVDADIDDDGEIEAFIPNTFGKQSDIYGAQLGNRKFDASYLAQIAKGQTVGLGSVDKALADPQLKTFVGKYAGNNNAFLKDLNECYLKLTTLGYQGTKRND